MRDLRIASVFAAVDAANSDDPNLTDAGPLALVQGQLGSAWLKKLTETPTPELQVAVRAHHLKRWELLRSNYPEGRAGYLRWRKDNKAHQANAAAEILAEHDWSTEHIDRVRLLLSRSQLRTDSDTQHLEDAACLVFLETQFDAMSEQTDADRMVTIVVKTLKKMSPQAISLAGSLAFGRCGEQILADAVKRMHNDA